MQLNVNDLSCASVQDADGHKFLAPVSLDAMQRCCGSVTANPGLVPEVFDTGGLPQMKCTALARMYIFERLGACNGASTLNVEDGVKTLGECVDLWSREAAL